MPRARVLAIVTIAAAMIAAPARAATLTVTTTADETVAGDHACSLREAIAAVDSPGTANGDCAAAAFGPNTIVLGAHTYPLGITPPGGPFNIATNVSVTINGADEARTTLDAQFLHSRVFEIAAGAKVTISSLTITGGLGPAGSGGAAGPHNIGGAGGSGGNGGAILNAGSLTILNAAVTNSTAGPGADGGSPVDFASSGLPGNDGGTGGDGGAIFNTGDLALVGDTIAGNHGGAGGAGGNAGGLGTGGSNHGGNGGAGGEGGGLANGGGTVTISDTTFRGNSAGSGGNGGAGGTASGAPGTPGGAGGNAGAGGSGGGVSTSGGSLAATNSTFASNASGSGGSGGAGGTGTGVGGAGGVGGAIGTGGGLVVGAGAAPKLLNDSFVGNQVGTAGSGGPGGAGTPAAGAGLAGSGAGVGGVDGSPLTLQNSLLALNASGNCGGSVSDGGHNLSFGGTGCPATFIAGDPDLGPLQDNGGPSQTISLEAGSAAIDKIPATGAGCPATDQRGVKRPAGTECDIGAYEFAPPKIGTVAVMDVGRTNATVNALVTPNASSGTVEVDYGRTKAYGSKAVKTAAGVAEIPIPVKLSHLRAKTTYHFRIVASAPDGTVTSADRTFATSPLPVLSKLKIKPSAFRAGGRGATITYTDSLAAKVRLVVLRRVRGPKRFVAVGSFTHQDKAGVNSIRFNGRLRSGKLARGSYRLELTGRANGRAGKTVAIAFRITG